MAEYGIKLRCDDGREISGTFTTSEDEDFCLLILDYDDCKLESEEDDFFDALCTIRNHLEQRGLVPLCYGASINVYPSGMGRDMGSGLKAYKMQRGKQARDLVHIFATGPDIVPSTVEEQREFFEEWLSALRSQ
jgi:hypothetical protein